eukprot:PhM_4_TR18016/c0_g1_i7/m.33311
MMWEWVDGPEAGQSVFATAWSGQWASAPANTAWSVAKLNAAGTFEVSATTATANIICEYGGTEGSLGFRGAIRLTMSQVACDVPDSRRFYEFPGSHGCDSGPAQLHVQRCDKRPRAWYDCICGDVSQRAANNHIHYVSPRRRHDGRVHVCMGIRT